MRHACARHVRHARLHLPHTSHNNNNTHALTHVQRKSLARTPAQDLHNTPLLQPHPRLEVE